MVHATRRESIARLGGAAEAFPPGALGQQPSMPVSGRRTAATIAMLLAMSAFAGAQPTPRYESNPSNGPGGYPSNRPPIKREWPDGPNKEFLRYLQRPDNHKHPERDQRVRSCCDAGDTVRTKFKVEPGGGPHPEDRWYAWLNDKWVAIPPDVIVPDYAPDGQAYLFVIEVPNETTEFDVKPGMIQVIACFVRPKGGL